MEKNEATGNLNGLLVAMSGTNLCLRSLGVLWSVRVYLRVVAFMVNALRRGILCPFQTLQFTLRFSSFFCLWFSSGLDPVYDICRKFHFVFSWLSMYYLSISNTP